MAKKIKCKAIKETSRGLALKAYLQFINYVTGKVNALGGVEEVLQNQKNKWLVPHYERVLNFAEKIEIVQAQNEKEPEEENPLDKLFQVNVTLSDNLKTEPK